MNNKTKKVINEYWAYELGLPVLIRGVSVVEIDGDEVVDIDYSKISEALFAALILKPFPLTGSEVKFMRLFMELTLEDLATKLHVTHPTVLSWEKSKNEPTKMTDSTEAILRIFAAKQGAKDHELIEVVLNKFFTSQRQEDDSTKSATIIELDALRKEEPPMVHFSQDEDDLSSLQEA